MPVLGKKVFHIYPNVVNCQSVKKVVFCLNVFKY